MLELLLWPFLAGLVLTGIHVYFGQHVLARGIIFVDLSLAQVAALGVTVAILAGHTVQSPAAYWYALGFAIMGAIVFALARRFEAVIQQEAIIGIVYAVCAALGILALDRAPQGAEHIKQILIGSILTVDAQDVKELTLLYGAIGVVHWFMRRPLTRASFEPEKIAAKGGMVLPWDILFYGSFALVVTSSVRIAGVLLVFCYLIVPAAIAGMLHGTLTKRLVLGWMIGALSTAGGLAASWHWDLPTGPAIVAAFGAVAVASISLSVLYRLKWFYIAAVTASASLLAGMLLAAFPQMDQPWLDGLEDVMPIMQEAFLAPAEVIMRRETLESIKRAENELSELKARAQDVSWGKLEMTTEKQDRLRQYISGRSEILAGDVLTLNGLRDEARSRQRYALGLPMFVFGVAIWYLLLRPQRSRRRVHGDVKIKD